MKRKLLFAIVALMCSVGTWAGDITSNLPAIGANWGFSFTNVSGSDDTHQGENITEPDPKGQCADMGTYKFAEVYNGRATGTEFEIYKELSVSNGTYIFQMAAFGRFANMGETGTKDINGEIFANGATVAVTSGEFVYYTVTTTVTDGTLKVGLRAKSGNRPNWWGYTDYTLVKVDDESNVDLTKLLVNSSFECNSTIGWKLDNLSSDTGVKTSTGNYTTAGIDGTYLFNTWWQGLPITQTITNMPNGVYTVTASLASSDDNADGKLYLLAQDGHSDVITITQGTKGTFNNYNHAFSVTNNSVTVGVVGGNADGTYNADGHWWYKADNFRLKFTARVNLSPETFTSGSSVSANTWYAYTVPANGWYTITPNAAGTFTYTQDGTQTVDAVFPRFYAPTTGKFQYLTKGTFYFKSNTAATVTIAATEISAGDDVTGYINDPSFEHVALNNDSPTSTDLMDWEGTSDAGEAFISYKINTRIYSGVDGNNLYNTWGGTHANGFYLKQTLHNQPSGFYKLTCSVASDANASVRVAFGDAYSDVACGTDKTAGHEANVLLYNESEGDVLISLTCANWFKADNFTLTYIGTSPREVLHDAIEDASAYTLGFEDGEYAPYNNVAGIAALAAAETTYENGSATIGELYDATTALNGATWTPNVGEVNAIFDGSFEHDYSGITGDVQPLGWHRTSEIGDISGDDTGYQTRYMSIPSGINVDGHTNTSQKGMMTKFHAFYGEDNGYTMPLKGNTYYTFSFLYAGWSDCNNRKLHINIYKPNGELVSTIYPTKNISLDEVDGNTNAEHWYYYEGVFTTETEGNYLIGLIKDGGNANQNQYVFTDFKLFRATASEIKPLLNSEIVAANTTYNSGANVGEGVFQIPTSAGTAFNTAINDAQDVYDNEGATNADIQTAIGDLQTAIDAYNNVTLNVPAEGDAYNLYLVDGICKTVTFKDGNVNAGGYAIGYTEDAGSFYNQAIHFKSTATSNQYHLYIIDADGGKHYLCPGTVYSGDNNQIRTTSDEGNALAVEVIVTSDNGVYNLKNTVADALIGSNGDEGVYTAQTYKKFNINAAAEVSVPVNLSAGKYATRIFPFTPSLPSAIKAYSCAEVDGTTLTLVEEAEPAANVPYILYSEEGYSGDALTGYGTATATEYKVGLLTGIYNTPTIAANAHHYVLQTKDNGEQAFCIVATDFTNTAPYRAYLTYEAPAPVKFLSFDFGNATGIDTVQGSSFKVQDSKIFNLAGQKMSKLQKGVNIVNGKKVLVK